MTWLAFFLSNLGLLAFMLLFSLIWNIIANRRARRMGKILHVLHPTRHEWWGYYRQRVKSYLVSYVLVLGVLLLLPLLFGQRGIFRQQLANLGRLLPGLIGYFLLVGLVPAKFVLYEQGFSSSALIPFLPGRRMDPRQTVPSVFRVGAGFWAEYRYAFPRGEVLLVHDETTAVEILIPKGEKDRLLSLVREGFKKVRDERRQKRRQEKGSRPSGEEMEEGRP